MIIENPNLVKTVETNGELKKMLVEYVGTKQEPEDGNVTVEMIVNVLSEEFPEFVMVVAEENWMRGYEAGLDDAKIAHGGTDE